MSSSGMADVHVGDRDFPAMKPPAPPVPPMPGAAMAPPAPPAPPHH
jgi:hypothetical protein